MFIYSSCIFLVYVNLTLRDKIDKFRSLVILKEHFPDMENPLENADAVEVIDENIIDAFKTIRYRNKKRPDENTIADYLCYPDCNVTTIRQRITYLENKNKI